MDYDTASEIVDKTVSILDTFQRVMWELTKFAGFALLVFVVVHIILRMLGAE